jgi:hypothetical protein
MVVALDAVPLRGRLRSEASNRSRCTDGDQCPDSKVSHALAAPKDNPLILTTA